MLGYWFLCDFVVVQAGRGQQPGVEQQHYAAGPAGQARTYPSQAKEQSRRHLLTDSGEERIIVVFHILVKPKNRAGATFSQTQVRTYPSQAKEQSRRHLLPDTGEDIS